MRPRLMRLRPASLVLFSCVLSWSWLGAGGTPACAQELSVTPQSADWALGIVGLEVDFPRVISLFNAGAANLRVTQVVIDAGPAGGGRPNDFRVDASALLQDPLIPPGASRRLEVAFHPTRVGSTTARLVIVTDIHGAAPAHVALTGTARASPIVQIATEQQPPELANFDLLAHPGCVDQESEAVRVGLKVPLNGILVTLADIRSTNPRFRIDLSETWRGALSPGRQTAFRVSFAPTLPQLESGQVEVYVEGFAEPSARVMLKGTGKADCAPPVVEPAPGCTLSRSASRDRGGCALLLSMAIAGLLLRRRAR